jgi:hypothetical protein
MRFAAFPVREAKAAIIKAEPTLRAQLRQETDAICNEFARRFGKESVVQRVRDEADEFRWAAPVGGAAEAADEGLGVRVETTVGQNMATIGAFAAYDEEVRGLIEECGDVMGIDPLYQVYLEASARTEVHRLADELDQGP